MHVYLTCWTCGGNFPHSYGPGAPPKYCGDECRMTARVNRQRLAYVARAEMRRLTQAGDHFNYDKAAKAA